MNTKSHVIYQLQHLAKTIDEINKMKNKNKRYQMVSTAHSNEYSPLTQQISLITKIFLILF